MKSIKIITLSVLNIAVALQIVSLATNYWITWDGKTHVFAGGHIRFQAHKTNLGLWKNCSHPLGQSSRCVDLSSNLINSNLKAARGQILVSLILTLASVGLIGASFRMDNIYLLRVTIIIVLLQAIIQSGGCSAGTKWLNDFNTKYEFLKATPGWSLYVGFVSAGIYAFTVALTYIAYKTEKGDLGL